MSWVVIIIMTLALSACTPAELFSQMATSEEEQAAQVYLARQEQQRQKLELIEAKKANYTEFMVLTQAEENSPFQAIVYRNSFDSEQKSVLDIEAIVPDPEGRSYQVWVKQPEDKIYQLLGDLNQKGVDDYGFVYESKEDLTGKSHITLSLDEPGLTQPQNIILTGAFPSAKTGN